jgi:hypothetical protein
MIPKKSGPDLVRAGHRFSERIMRQHLAHFPFGFDSAKLVIAGLDPAISLSLALPFGPKRDGRDKPGHDDSAQVETALI